MPAILPRRYALFTREGPGLRGESQVDISNRQAQVLRLIAWGYSSKEIAAQLSISVKTVESHKAAAMRKLDMNSRVDIVRYALREGWFEE